MVKRSTRDRVLAYAVLFAAFVSAAAEAGDLRSTQTGTEKPGAAVSALPEPEELSSAVTGTRMIRDFVEPLFVRPLMRIGAGKNDSNPHWSPGGTLLAFERSIGDKKEIHIVYDDGTPVEKVYFQVSSGGSESKFFFPGVYEEVSYNAGISWSPGGDRFIFMSNAGEGNYDLYLQELGATAARLTDHREKDGQAHWSPAADRILFVSGRTGNGDVYLMNLPARALTRLTRGGKAYLYPRWSPTGKQIVMMHGSTENHDIILIADPSQPDTRKSLTTWSYDDLRPVWSPDGRKIAFYSNYNPDDDPKVWSIVVIAADGSDPTEGEGLAGKVVATDVIPDVEAGPAWMPDSTRIVYVKNDRQEYNPLYIADIRRKNNSPIRTDTKMNHDVACSRNGTLAFRAQVNQWDQIYIMKLKQ